MNYFSAQLAAIAFFLTVFTAESQTNPAGTQGTGKPFTVSVGLRNEYDDNIFTTKTNKQESWKSIISPSITFNYPLEQTSFSASYSAGVTYYWDRPDDDFDFSHSLTGKINHRFSPRATLDVGNSFRIPIEPEIRDNNTTTRRQGDYIVNDATLDFSYDWTERFATVTGYGATLSHYEDDFARIANNYLSQTLSQDFRFTVSPTTTAVFNYAIQWNDYEYIDRDSFIHTFAIGADHRLSPVWTLAGRAGAQYKTFSNSAFKDDVSPYVNLSSTWRYSPRDSISASYQYATTLTDFNQFSSELTHSFSLSNTHYLMPKFSMNNALRLVLGDFEQEQAFNPANDGGTETTVVYDLGLNYQLYEWMGLLAGYSYVTLQSFSATREYDRNRVYMGLRFTY